MLRLSVIALDVKYHASLLAYQAEVDAAPDYPGKVALAKRLFGLRNTKDNETFRHVRETLSRMCSGARRCCYCEDNVADEVEHLRPKDLYPEQVFSWDNYVYACGSCNGPKNNKFAVIDAAGTLNELSRRRGAAVVPPLAGAYALIDPRTENPLDYFDLGLSWPYHLLPKDGLDPVKKLRAEYTERVLVLNREVLLKSRENAYGSYRARLVEYLVKRSHDAPQAALDALRDGLRGMPHPTVWAEMKRSHASFDELNALFSDAPEALTW